MILTHTHAFFFSAKDFCSNWYPCRFQVQGIEFNCVEQMMMFAKARKFGDAQAMRAIMAASHPADQKKLGRAVRSFDDQRWAQVSRRVVYAAAHAKFTQNEELLVPFLDTAPRILVEASRHDKLWGAGLAATDPRIHDPALWPGKNWLGQVLTRLRDDLSPVPARAPSPT